MPGPPFQGKEPGTATPAYRMMQSPMMESFDRFVTSKLAYAALAILVFIAALPGVVGMPVLDRDEGRFTQATSQMLETGDYVVIRYHEGLRNKKPVGLHWMQAASVALTVGPEARQIWSYRMPSLLAAMLAAMATFWCGSALFSRRAAFIGAALLGVCLLLSTEAHIAKTDAAQCGFLALMMGCLAHMRLGHARFADQYGAAAENPDRNRRLSVIFWVCLAIGVLLKGVIAPMVGGLALAGLFLWERKLNWARPLLYWMGISLFCVIAIPWFIAVQIATGGAFLFEAAAVDLGQKIVSAAEGHEGPPGLHLATLPLLFWPGVLLLIPGFWLAASSLWRRDTLAAPALRTGGDGRLAAAAEAATKTANDRNAAAWRFLACWIIPAWLVFEFAPTKLVHYTLPMYPAIALVCGAGLDRWFNDPSRMRTVGAWISLGLFVVISGLIAYAASPAALAALRADAAASFGPDLADRVQFMWAEQWRSTGVGLWPTLLILAAVAGVGYAFWRKSALGLFAGVILAGLIGGISYRGIILPNQAWILSSEAALSALREVCALPAGSAEWEKSQCGAPPADATPPVEPLRAPTVVRAIAFAEPSLVFALGGKITLPGDEGSVAVIPPAADDPRPAWLINAGEPEGVAAISALVEAAAAADRCIRFARRYAMNYSNGDPSVLVAVVVEPAGCPATDLDVGLRPTIDEEPVPELEN